LPSRRTHVKFDEYLKEHGIICSYTYADMVHDRMDRDARKHGHWRHQELDYYHEEEGIRTWLRKWSHLAYQETLTDYLRVALGHLVLDDMKRRYEYPNEDELIKSAYRSFIQRGLAGTFFKE
jgi:hypothetical protein